MRTLVESQDRVKRYPVQRDLNLLGFIGTDLSGAIAYLMTHRVWSKLLKSVIASLYQVGEAMLLALAFLFAILTVFLFIVANDEIHGSYRADNGSFVGKIESDGVLRGEEPTRLASQDPNETGNAG